MELNNHYRQCPNGHWYDASLTDTCPQCAAAGAAMEPYGVTEPIPRGGYDVGRTEPAGGGVERYSPTVPVDAAYVPAEGRTVEDTSGGGAKVEPYGATMPAEAPSGAAVQGFSPVVGWLVCVEGPDRGRDYRIHSGYNRIGRAEHMDICISGDPHISRARHAMIAYDPEERVFFFGPDEGKSIVRLNGKLVMAPSELHAYDIITLGASASPTRLMFIPFCGERFSWDG